MSCVYSLQSRAASAVFMKLLSVHVYTWDASVCKMSVIGVRWAMKMTVPRRRTKFDA